MIRTWRRKETGSPSYNSDPNKTSNKQDGGKVSPVLYIRKYEWDKEALRNQNKSEGSDIPKPKYDKRAS